MRIPRPHENNRFHHVLLFGSRQNSVAFDAVPDAIAAVERTARQLARGAGGRVLECKYFSIHFGSNYCIPLGSGIVRRQRSRRCRVGASNCGCAAIPNSRQRQLRTSSFHHLYSPTQSPQKSKRRRSYSLQLVEWIANIQNHQG